VATCGRRALQPLTSARALAIVVALASTLSASLLELQLANAQSVSVPASDERQERARELFREAEQKERAGAYDAALLLFRGVGALQMTPAVHFHIGHCHELLGHLGTAFFEYTTARTEAEDKGKRETSKAAETALVRVEPRVAKLRARCVAAAQPCSFLVDGKRIDSPDGVARVDAGIRMVEVTMGTKSMRKDASAVDGTTLDVDADLTASVEAAIAIPDAHIRSGEDHDATTDESKTGASRTRTSRAPAILATGGAVLFAGAGFAAFAFRALDTAALGSWISAALLATLAIIWWAQPAHPTPRSARRQAPQAPQATNGTAAFWLSTSGTHVDFGGTF
jgi:hypothetical protein